MLSVQKLKKERMFLIPLIDFIAKFPSFFARYGSVTPPVATK
jgi:hypothetical protein